jgi:hypothetical protein
VNYEARQTASLKIFNPIAGEPQIFPKKLSAMVGK